jgi:hypothetical protein
VGVDVLELLAGEPEAQVVHFCPAQLLGDADAEELELCHLGEEAPLETVLAVEVVDLGGDLASRPVANRLLDRLLLFRQLEIDHRPSLKRLCASNLRGAASRRQSAVNSR